MLADNVNDLLVEYVLFSLLLLYQAIGFLESVEDLVVKVNFFPKLGNIILPYLLVHFVHALGLLLFAILLLLVNGAVFLEAIFSRVVGPIVNFLFLLWQNRFAFLKRRLFFLLRAFLLSFGLHVTDVDLSGSRRQKSGVVALWTFLHSLILLAPSLYP